MTRFVVRLRCLLGRHVWRVTRMMQSANVHLMHLHPLAGCDAICRNCGKQWFDFENFNRRPWL